MNRTGLIKLFKEGATSGKASRISISGNKLFSYWAVIAIRLSHDRVTEDGRRYRFIISNKTSSLGGDTYSSSTSCHISAAYNGLSPNILVDGWAEDGKPEWIIPILPTHKTLKGLVRYFACGGYGGYFGEWDGKEAHRKAYIDNGCLFNENGELVAEKEYISHDISYCKGCNISMACLTSKSDYGQPFSGYKVTIVKPDDPLAELINNIAPVCSHYRWNKKCLRQVDNE